MNQAIPFSPAGTVVSPEMLQPARVRRSTTPSFANDLYELTKPRMNLLVLITTMVGYYMAVTDAVAVNWPRVVHTALGTALCAAAAGVMNQVVERDFDKLMPRTRLRPLPAGRVSRKLATVYGLSLGVLGVAYLFIAVNPLTASLGLATILGYLLVYTPMKRRSTLNTVIGAIPGAIPPVMGWTAVRNGLSPEALALFGILFLWQMPHFLAIAILYKNDYAAGGFKMLPVVDEDLRVTGRQIILYGAVLIPVSLMPSVLGMTGAVYFVAAMVLGLAFLTFGVTAAATRQRIDSRKLFFASIIYLPLLLAVMMLNKL